MQLSPLRILLTIPTPTGLGQWTMENRNQGSASRVRIFCLLIYLGIPVLFPMETESSSTISSCVQVTPLRIFYILLIVAKICQWAMDNGTSSCIPAAHPGRLIQLLLLVFGGNLWQWTMEKEMFNPGPGSRICDRYLPIWIGAMGNGSNGKSH